MVKKRSPTEKIEREKRTFGVTGHYGEIEGRERSWIKFPRKPMVDVTSKSGRNYVEANQTKIQQELDKHGRTKFSSIHNHPVPEYKYEEGIGSVPSYADLFYFLLDDQEKSLFIAQQNTETGKVEGYYVFRKTRKTPQFSRDMRNFLKECQKDPSGYKIQDALINSDSRIKKLDEDIAKYEYLSLGSEKQESQRQLDELLSNYHIQAKYLPAKGYKYHKGFRFSPLEASLKIITPILIGIFIFLGYTKITGNVIGNIGQSSGSGAVITLLIIGLVAGFFWLKSRKK
jgi:hypothetical protein